jgi:hypothetical protein
MVGKKKTTTPMATAAPLPVPGVDPEQQAVQQSLLNQLAALKMQGDQQLNDAKQQQLTESEQAKSVANQMQQQNALVEQQNVLNATRYKEATDAASKQEQLTSAQAAASTARRNDQRVRTTGLLASFGRRANRPNY